MATATRTPLPSETPTAPLPPAAVAAMSRLELRLADRTVADVVAHELASYVRAPEADPVGRAVVRFSICQATIDRISQLDVRSMTPAQFGLLASAQRELAVVRAQLAEAGALHRVELGAAS